MTLASFIVFLALFLGVGLASMRKATGARKDYYLAGSSVSPWLVGLSAVATNNSGYMFIGVIGFTYAVGLPAIWLMIGWIAGDFIASTFIHRRLRETAERTSEASYPAVLAGWTGQHFDIWRRVAALVMLVFLGSYAAAQIAAGGKALQGTFGWDPSFGAIGVAAMVMAYSLAGGIRASIWTDAVQSFVMLAAMTLLFVVGIVNQGGLSGVIARWNEVPDYLNFFPNDLLLPGVLGMAFFVLGWLFAGFSVVGQPHVMIRFMTLKEPSGMVRARVWYYSYFTMFYALATGVGMLSRIYLPELAEIDPELALPTMARELFHPVLVGMVLAGIFAATMSTADSLVLSCSAAITHDLGPERLEQPWMLKTATAVVIGLALVIALSGNESVFSLVILSWGVLASAFAPLLTLYALGRRLDEIHAVALMILGVGTALAWRQLGWHNSIYEGMPGILVPVLVGWVMSRSNPAHVKVASSPAAGE